MEVVVSGSFEMMKLCTPWCAQELQRVSMLWKEANTFSFPGVALLGQWQLSVCIRSSLLGRGCDVCWSCVSASNEFPNLDIMKSHLSVSAGVTILMMTLGRDQLHIRGISFVPVLMLAGADRKLWPWHERQAHPATCYTPRTKERAKVVTNGGLFVKAHTPTRVVQAALRAETSWARIRVNTTWKRFKGTSEAIPESVAEMQSVL